MTRQMNNLSLFKHKKAVHGGYFRDIKKQIGQLYIISDI